MLNLITSCVLLLSLSSCACFRDILIKDKAEIEKLEMDAFDGVIYDIPYKAPETPVRAL